MTADNNSSKLSSEELDNIMDEMFGRHEREVKETLDEDLFVRDDEGNTICMINASLVLRKKVSKKKLIEIKELHKNKARIFEQMKKTDDIPSLKNLAEDVRAIEFRLQKAWGFPLDARFHGWYEVPKCSCPKLDNLERRGTSYQIIAHDCVIHGLDGPVAGQIEET